MRQNLKKAARTSSALVVHLKLCHRAELVKLDDFAVLSSDIYYCARRRSNYVCTDAVGNNLWNIVVSLEKRLAAVPGGYDISNILLRHTNGVHRGF